MLSALSLGVIAIGGYGLYKYKQEAQATADQIEPSLTIERIGRQEVIRLLGTQDSVLRVGDDLRASLIMKNWASVNDIIHDDDNSRIFIGNNNQSKDGQYRPHPVLLGEVLQLNYIQMINLANQYMGPNESGERFKTPVLDWKDKKRLPPLLKWDKKPE